MKKAKVAIIGCGASGLLCAIVCARAGLAVDIYEQNSTCGKKIKVSGNGKCNIANKNASLDDFFGRNKAMIQNVLQRFGYEEIEKFFNSLGLMFVTHQDGRVFPFSKEAKTVVDVLVAQARAYGVRFFVREKIETIEQGFRVRTTQRQAHYDYVVLANGSQAAEHLGGNTSGYLLAQSLGHSLQTPYPALVQLITRQKTPQRASGVKLACEAALSIDGELRARSTGDVLFSDYGLSGLAILDLSLEASRALMRHQSVKITLNVVPELSRRRLESHLLRCSSMRGYTLLRTVSTIIPVKLARTIITEVGLSVEQKTLHTKEAKRLAYTLGHWTFDIVDTKGFRYAEVCGGGVDSLEVSAETFMSTSVSGLYIVGELLDIVGRRGGYNFMFAWGSGYLAACDIIKKINSTQKSDKKGE